MELKIALQKLGLTATETSTYLFLLEHGPSSVAEIAKATRVLRTNCYGVLHKLQKRGLVEVAGKQHPATYAASTPSSLLRDLENRRQTIDSVLPDLLSLYKDQAHKPTIRFFSGKEEVQEIFYQMLGTRELVAFASTDTLHTLYPGFFTGEWQREFRKRGGTLRDILTIEGNNSAAREMRAVLGSQYDYRLIPKGHRPTATDVLVWDENVALITLEKPIFGTLLHSKQMADTFRLMFELMWTSLAPK